ncbi:MAG TPA: leishmanolysin-related zinc metalloendopeptidase [Longimicrobiales bacterium]|nr:leishmanolysin-related zinc metalloendopeptidase [Longimicrobiales bacterium]
MKRSNVQRAALRASLVVLAGLAASCSDASNPTAPPVASAVVGALEVSAGDGQTATVRTAVATPPAVLVRDRSGQPAAGVTVTFRVAAGGGSVGQGTAVTDSGGIASAGRWTLGAQPGANALVASAGGSTVRFTATAVAVAAPTSPAGGYTIGIRWISSPSDRHRQAVQAAVARWQQVITADLVDVPLKAAAGACFQTQPAINEMVDDLVIYIEFVPIDGAGKVLGSSGPCYVRSDNGLPVMGYMKLDVEDLRQMETRGTLDDVVLHEMGHVLGIGTLWTDKGLLAGAGTDDPTFTGQFGIAGYRDLGGTRPGVPVENTGDTGTRDGHWRESVFGNELMTGYINSAGNPLSEMTVTSLRDLGYGANPGAASGYTITNPTGTLVSGTHLGGERLVRPKARIDRHGRHHKP